MANKVIRGDLSITASDGTVLRASHDLKLAWLWAEAEIRAGGVDWDTVPYPVQVRHVGDALTALRDAYAATEE